MTHTSASESVLHVLWGLDNADTLLLIDAGKVSLRYFLRVLVGGYSTDGSSHSTQLRATITKDKIYRHAGIGIMTFFRHVVPTINDDWTVIGFRQVWDCKRLVLVFSASLF